ncbi:MAG: gamma-glutamyltransferase [Parvibaculum sp.]|nr:gamma-glutamyltransferase [Parvibaculum sp.]
MWLNYEGRTRRTGVTLAAFAVILGLSACADEGPRDPVGLTAVSHGVETAADRRARLTTAGQVAADTRDPWFAGAVVADEPSAVLLARQVLEQGGNAADAAAAVYFGLSVTYPAAAGLGGGGVCLVHEAGKKTVETVSFLTRNPAGGGAIAVPGNVRGFALIHSRYGKLPWGSLVAPAERLAATGTPVSRATARQLADAASVIEASPALKKIFANGKGAIAGELDTVTRIHLAATLAQVRSQGVGGFYSGQTAQRLIEASAKAGGALSIQDLRNYRPELIAAQSADMGTSKVWLPAGSLGAGAFGAALWSNLGNAGPGELAEAARRTAIQLGAPADIDRDFGSTAFAAIDGAGGAVACAVTMNGAFGSGKVAEGTGVVLAASPSQPVAGLASAFLAPVIVTGASGEYVRLSGAGAGAPKGAAAIQYVGRNAQTIDAANAALANGPADARSPANAIVCPDGIASGSCGFAINPGGNGMAATGIAGS